MLLLNLNQYLFPFKKSRNVLIFVYATYKSISVYISFIKIKELLNLYIFFYATYKSKQVFISFLKFNDATYIFLSMQKSKLMHYFVQGMVSSICISMRN